MSPPKTNSLAQTSLASGLFSLVFILGYFGISLFISGITSISLILAFFIPGILSATTAIGTGMLSLYQIGMNEQLGKAFAVGGIVIGIAVVSGMSCQLVLLNHLLSHGYSL